MKKLIRFAMVWLAFFIMGSPMQCQAQEAAGYTFIRGPMGTQVCLGRYVPPTADAVTGVCDGQVLDLAQFNSISNKLSADRLDQATQILEAIDYRLAVSNDKVE